MGMIMEMIWDGCKLQYIINNIQYTYVQALSQIGQTRTGTKKDQVSLGYFARF